MARDINAEPLPVFPVPFSAKVGKTVSGQNIWQPRVECNRAGISLHPNKCVKEANPSISSF